MIVLASYVRKIPPTCFRTVCQGTNTANSQAIKIRISAQFLVESNQCSYGTTQKRKQLLSALGKRTKTGAKF